jgi:putative ABC transport system permease protein
MIDGLSPIEGRVPTQRRFPSLESIAADLRYAVRQLRRNSVSTVTMILVLSLGIGTNVVLFTVLNSIATLPAPGLARDASLVRLRGTVRPTESSEWQSRLLSWPEIEEFTRRTDLFSSVVAHADESGTVHTGGASATLLTVSVIYTTSNYFGTLEVRPAVGREPTIDPGVQLSAPPTTIISHAMWQQQFGGARDVVGRTVRINDFPVEIVGVAPPRFLGTSGGTAMTMWVPLAAYPLLQKRTPAVFVSNDSVFLSAAARLQPGVTPSQASAVVSGIAERSFRPGPDETGSADVVPMLASNDRIGDRRDLLLSGTAIGGFALLALLITCTNVSALMIGLAVARRREVGVRLALGAPRKRLIRQLLTESVLLALVAATVSLLVTTVGIRVLRSTFSDVQLVVDWRVTTMTVAVAIVTGIVFGLAPALHATRVTIGEVLKSSSGSVAAARSRLQRVLVVAQIAVTQPMLVGLGVVVLTIVTDAGSAGTSRVRSQIAEVELDTWAGRVSPAERASRIAAAVERVAAMPGVAVALPMQMGTMSALLSVHPADRVDGVTPARAMEAQMTAAPQGYFSALAIPIERGRDFGAAEYASASHDAAEGPLSAGAAIIGSDLARTLWGDADPLGRRFTLGTAVAAGLPTMVVVGVVNESAAGPGELNGRIRLYVPYSSINTGVIARTTGPALPLLNAMRTVVAAEAPHMPIVRVQTMEQREVESRRSVLRASAAVAGGGILALLLSAIGLYAVVSQSVGQRTREIGIRTALGAPRGRILRMFFAEGIALSALGLLLGLPLSIFATRYIVSTLSWQLSSSPLLGIGIGAVVLVVAAVAVGIPARRASTVDPTLALRGE